MRTSPGPMDRGLVLDLALRLFPYDEVYPQQRDFMKRMIDTIAEGKVGIFESPTGTGKSLSLLCATLAWQQLKLSYDDERENELFSNNECDEKILNKKRAPKRSKRPAKRAEIDLDDKVASLLRSLESESDADPEDTNRRARVFFCSRTHSQLSQVMGELDKIIKKGPSDLASDYVSLSLGSRSNLCINKDVSKLGSSTRINEKCLELQADSCCAYYNDDKKPSLELLRDAIARLHVADIEDMVGLGRKINACPYYASREALDRADLVTIPYNILLHRETRESYGIDLEDAIVIVDEAHNLIDAINQLYSLAIDQQSIRRAQHALVAYADRYGKRLSPAHMLLISQLIHALSMMSQFKPATDAVYGINDFLHDCRIDTLNIFPIEVYLVESRLSSKVASFYEAAQLNDANLLNELVRFLAMLSSADCDGRVLVTRTEESSCSIKFITLNPGEYFKDILDRAHSVVLAGGTMSPCADYIDQLFGLDYPTDSLIQFACGHLIPPENCTAVALAMGPSNVAFDFSFSSRSNPAVVQELGQAIVNLVNITPDGVVCFFPSYAYMDQVMAAWEQSSVMKAIKAKKQVVVESGSNVESLMSSFREKAVDMGGAILFGVMGGRLSEGINFSDRLARLCIVVGLPFPNSHEPEMAERISNYLRRKERMDPACQRSTLKSEFLENLTMRTVNQTIGRVIRHKADFAAIVLIDQRYQQQRIQQKVSSWLQPSIISANSFGPAFATVSKFFKQHKA